MAWLQRTWHVIWKIPSPASKTIGEMVQEGCADDEIEDPYPAPVGPWEGAILIGDALRTAALALMSRSAAAAATHRCGRYLPISHRNSTSAPNCQIKGPSTTDSNSS